MCLLVWVSVWLCVGATWVRARMWVGACVGACVGEGVCECGSVCGFVCVGACVCVLWYVWVLACACVASVYLCVAVRVWGRVCGWMQMWACL